jgi:regulator of RNase E activity RraA
MTGFRIAPHPPGVAAAVHERFRDIDAATIGHLTDRGYLASLRPLFTPIRLLGPAVTVRTPAFCGAVIREALIAARTGDVLVIEMVGDRRRACWGELRTLAAMSKGLAGVVVAGAVTDSRAIRDLGFPVFSIGVSAITTRGGGQEGEVNVPLDLDGVRIEAGDLVLGDEDGVFSISATDAPGLSVAAARRAADEKRKRLRLKAWDRDSRQTSGVK